MTRGLPGSISSGAGLSIAGLTAIVWGLIEAPERGWGAPVILAAFAVGAAIMATFVAWERRSAHPMLDVRVFRNLRFSAASVSVTFMFFALMGVLYFLTTYLQTVLGYGTFDTGRARAADRRRHGLASRPFGARSPGGSAPSSSVAGGLGIVALALGQFTSSASTPATGRSPPRCRARRSASGWRCRPRPKRSWARCPRPRPASARR